MADQSGGATIVIGDTGNVSGTGFASGSASALTIDGNADANGLLAVQGMDLRSGGSSDITIQGSGNITGMDGYRFWTRPRKVTTKWQLQVDTNWMS